MQIQDEEKDSMIMVFETLTNLGPGIQDEDKDSMIMMMVMLVFWNSHHSRAMATVPRGPTLIHHFLNNWQIN